MVMWVGQYQEYLPPRELQPFVATLWSYVGGEHLPQRPAATKSADVADAQWERVLPDGCLDLIADLPGANSNPAPLAVFGPTDRVFLVDGKIPGVSVGVRFHPGMAAQLLRIQPPTFFRQVIPVADCAPHLVTLARRLADCTDLQQALRLMVDQLRIGLADQVKPSARLQQAVTLLQQTQGQIPIQRLAENLDVSERTLHRDFTSMVGLAPKLFARILRFQATAARLTTASDWARLALELGYADQAHLSRDFHLFAGVSPTVYVQSK